MRKFESELAENADVKVVTFDSAEMAGAYRSKFDLDWPMLLDTEYELYRSYTMDRGSWWALGNPIQILRYLADIICGSIPGKKGKDIRQFGGDIVIDPEGIIRLFHPSQNPHDRPSAKKILALVTRTH